MARTACNAEIRLLMKPPGVFPCLKIGGAWLILSSQEHRISPNRRRPHQPAILEEEFSMTSEIKQTLQDVRHRLNQIKEYL